MDQKYLEAAEYFPHGIRERLRTFPEIRQGCVREICLRSERPLVVSTFQGEYFALEPGGFSQSLPVRPYIVSKPELLECVRILTEYSLHSYQQEINAGYITLRGGHRAGVAGSCVCENGEIRLVREISSVNLRIARQISGAAQELVRALYSSRVESTLIAGAPASGKTTLLKDIARALSSGEPGYYTKLSLIDERGELAAVYRGVPQNDVGALTDVFDGYRKGEGMSQAIRSMSPRAILIDEIAAERDAASIRQSLYAGVAVIASVHASSLDELYRKPQIRALIAEGAFPNIVLLCGAENPCRIQQIVHPKELVHPC